MPAKTQKARKQPQKRNQTSWKKGQPSPNPAGRPSAGESWADLIKKYGDMTAGEVAELSLELAKDYLKMGEGVTLKQGVILSVFRSLMHDPQPGLFNALMERAEGKVPDKLLVADWRAALLAKGTDPDKLLDDVVENVTPKLLPAPDTLPLNAALHEAATTDENSNPT
jgi:hypothetical protein